MKTNIINKLITLSLLILTAMSCKKQLGENDAIFNNFKDMEEIQLTSDQKGHFLRPTQCFSPDDSWIVYDTRNDGTHIGLTCCIEVVNTQTKLVR